jgi:hypothetical protein
MHDPALLETGCFAGLVLFCLVLPLMMSFRGPLDAATRRSCMKIVWAGQALLMVAGMTVLASAPLAPYAAALGLVSCHVCAIALVRQFQAARTA